MPLRRLARIIQLVLLPALLFTIPHPTAAASLVVYIAPAGSDGGSCAGPTTPCATLDYALTQALPGATIQLAAGTYSVENTTITTTLTLQGEDRETTILDAGLANRALSIDPGATVTLRDLTITDGQTTGDGGGILNQGTLTIERVIIRDCTALSGGAISNQGALTVRDSEIHGNQALGSPMSSLGTAGGAIHHFGTTLLIQRSSIWGNSAIGQAPRGGALAISFGSARIEDSTLALNDAISNATFSGGSFGGALISFAPTVIINSTIVENRSVAAPGTNQLAITATDGGISAQALVDITASIVVNNSADDGSPDVAGVFNSGGSNLLESIGGSSGWTSTDLIDVGVPGVEPFGDYGEVLPIAPPLPTGPVMTFPAAPCTPDQLQRPRAASCAIGAIQPDTTPFTMVFDALPRPTLNADGSGDLSLVSVQTRNRLGQTLPSRAVTLAIDPASGTAGAALTLSNDFPGAFINVVIDRPGAGYVLVATDPSGLLPPARSEPFTISAQVGAPTQPEIEPNDTIDQATPLVPDRNGSLRASGTVTSLPNGASIVAVPPAGDTDLFRIDVPPGATIGITLTNLANNFDLALMADPLISDTDTLTDAVDLSSIVDIGRDLIGRDLIGRDLIGRDLIGQMITAVSSNPGTAPESIAAFLPAGGRYYLVVYGVDGASDYQRSYQLDVQLNLDGAPRLPALVAPAAQRLLAAPNAAVRTIYVSNIARMASRYPQQTRDVVALDRLLQPGSALLAASGGVRLDLGDPTIAATDRELLARLYAQWDAAPDQPLYANEVAHAVRNLLRDATTRVYPNATDIVLVGGDGVLPFYRTPDENTLGNEADYLAQLKLVGSTIAPKSALYGSTFYRFIQTDAYFADFSPIAWRGRSLYLPDYGIGRLVEQPADIVRYLESYIGGSYTIDVGGESGAFVSGYDFLTDQATAIVRELRARGLAAQVGDSGPPIATLIGQGWKSDALANGWFSGQLGQLTSAYTDAASQTRLLSINGHFTHFGAIPADLTAPLFPAERVYTPTAALGSALFFNGGQKGSNRPTLLYSVGCQSGLSAPDEAFTAPAFQADFAQATMKQGGNWIGNTGFGYGDSDIVGYSERLSLLFTESIGRKVTDGQGQYIGASIGESMARAKREYLRTSGPGSFSVADEKVLSEWTLYGLPFVRVKLPNPSIPAYGASFDPMPAAVPASIRLTAVDGVYTRLITVTNTFSPTTDDAPIQVAARIEDSFVPGERSVIGVSQTLIGRPNLPLISYDITLAPSAAGAQPPEARGVRLLAAQSAITDPYNPRITRPVTDVLASAPPEPDLRTIGRWLPEIPYAVQRSDDGRSAVDQLLVMPAQLYGRSRSGGRLQAFTQMVFAITYADPSLSAGVSAERGKPAIARQRSYVDPYSSQIQVSAFDTAGGALRTVWVTYTADGQRWQRQPLKLSGDGSYAAALATALSDAANGFVEVVDSAGNVSSEPLLAPTVLGRSIFLPQVGSAALPNLSGALRVEGGRVIVTIRNSGAGDAPPFWVDLYASAAAPRAPRAQIWQQQCEGQPCYGLTWGVGGLAAGQSVELTSDAYAPQYSNWPGGIPAGTLALYLTVDSWDGRQSGGRGAVIETDETDNLAALTLR